MTSKPDPGQLYSVLAAHARGRARAIPATRVSELMGLDYRESGRGGNGAGAALRQLVNDAIAAGHPICSWSKGYYVPADAEDVRVGATEIRSRVKALLARLAKLDQNCMRHLARHPDPHGQGTGA